MDIAVLYARFSSSNQKEESIDAQVRAMRDYCERNNIVIAKIYADEAKSATTDDRPQFRQMIQDSKSKEWNMLIVHKLDRFSRDRYDHAFYKKELKKNGVKFISVLEQLDDSPESVILESVLEGMSEYYSKNLGREIKKGMKERCLKGKSMGMMPYGYYTDSEGNVCINVEQAEVVKKIYELYNSGCGRIKIARWLTEQGIKTYKGYTHWWAENVAQILTNRKYMGVNNWNNEIQQDIPAIVSQETWEKANRQAEEKRTRFMYRGSNYNKFLLLGLLKCGYCNNMFRVKTSNAGTKYMRWKYLCKGASLYRKCTHYNSFTATQMDTKIEKILFEIAKGTYKDFVVQKENTVDAASITTNRLIKIDKELERAKNAYMAELFTIDEYKSIKVKLEQEKVILTQQIECAALEEVSNSKVIENANNTLALYMSCQTIAEKKIIMMDFFKEIVVYEDKLEIVIRG